MTIEITVPAVGESITEVEIGGWLKAVGETVKKDEAVAVLESEKATVEVAAPQAGVLTRILKQKGEVANVGEVIAVLEPAGQPAPGGKEQAAAPPPEPKPEPAAGKPPVTPAAQAAPAPRAGEARGTGSGGRALEEAELPEAGQPVPPAPAGSEPAPPAPSPAPPTTASESGREEEVVPMSRLRRTVAERLVEAQSTAALLTTFNEIDMTGVIALRKDYGEAFQQKYQVKLGFMSFFVKAAIDALKQFPALNAEIRGANIVYHNFYDIGIAVGSGKGLVVPVLRNAERLSFAEIELAIGDFARRAKDNKLKVDELQGGTFTISNGGVYGSLLSTPIVSPPQSGVLGLHAVQDRPVARDGAVVIRPMMYAALTYDHRLVDGREAVSFLKRVKEVVEAPARMLMEV